MGIYLKSVRDYRCQMKLKNAQKNVHDALFFGHDSGGLRLWMFIQDGKIKINTTSQGGSTSLDSSILPFFIKESSPSCHILIFF